MKVTPVFIRDDSPVSVGDIIKRIKRLGFDDEEPVGSLATVLNPYFTKSDEWWQKQKLILVADGAIKKHDDYYSTLHKAIFTRFVDGYNVNEKKIIATQEDLDDKLVKKLIEDHNNGCLFDFIFPQEVYYTEKEVYDMCLVALEMGASLQQKPMPRLMGICGKDYFTKWFNKNKK